MRGRVALPLVRHEARVCRVRALDDPRASPRQLMHETCEGGHLELLDFGVEVIEIVDHRPLIPPVARSRIVGSDK